MTETNNVTTVTSKNQRPMKRGQCVTCGSTKTQLIKGYAVGDSFLNSANSKLPFEFHLQGHNFTEAGTNLTHSMLTEHQKN